MFNFNEKLYTDVRIEDVFETKISYKDGELEEQKVRSAKGAFIRVFDGSKWYYSAITDVANIQGEINELSSIANENAEILNNDIVKKFEKNIFEGFKYKDTSVKNIDINDKKNMLKSYFDLYTDDCISQISTYYVDKYEIKEFYSSKGSSIKYDTQSCGIRTGIQMVSGDKKHSESISKASPSYEEISKLRDFISSSVEKGIDFMLNSKPVEAGEYTVLLSPMATGVFTHESFGHKSESDFMVGDEAMAKEWAIGKKVGHELLNIIDSGIEENGYEVRFDDEGTVGKKTDIITKGILTDRLHSASTAAILKEELTGNARAMNFEYEPIVRMTTTYIEAGDRPKADIISEIKNGIYVDTIKHGSGMSTFTIAPNRAYKIENGVITDPIKVSVVTGNVFETLMEVDAISEEFDLLSFVGGGCGKMEQFPLSVGFGGPYTRVKKLTVQ